MCFPCGTYSRFRGKTVTGDKKDCEKDQTTCPIQPSACWATSQILIGEGNNLYGTSPSGDQLYSECYCRDCLKNEVFRMKHVAFEFGFCEKLPTCNVTIDDCKNRRLVFLKTPSGNYCECKPCSDFYQGAGTTSTGNYQDCTNCPD